MKRTVVALFTAFLFSGCAPILETTNHVLDLWGFGPGGAGPYSGGYVEPSYSTYQPEIIGTALGPNTSVWRYNDGTGSYPGQPQVVCNNLGNSVVCR